MGNSLTVIDGNKTAAGQHVQVAAPAFSFSDMQAMATSFAQGGMFGSTNPHAVLSLMLVAQAEGKHPAQIMQDYHVISNKPAKKADAMLRDFIASGGKVEWHQLDDECADATFSHPAGGKVRITWDEERVKQAQLGSNQMHKKYPRQMKRSRVVSEGVRTVFPGATGGFYVPEEVADFDDDKPAPPAAKRARDIKAEQGDKGRAKAEEWVGSHLAALDEVGDPDSLDAVMQAGQKAVAKLEREHTDLHRKVQDAYAAKAAEVAPSDEATDEPAGEVTDFASMIDAAPSPEALDEIVALIDEASASISEDELTELDAKVAARRRSIGKGEGQ